MGKAVRNGTWYTGEGYNMYVPIDVRYSLREYSKHTKTTRPTHHKK